MPVVAHYSETETTVTYWHHDRIRCPPDVQKVGCGNHDAHMQRRPAQQRAIENTAWIVCNVVPDVGDDGGVELRSCRLDIRGAYISVRIETANPGFMLKYGANEMPAISMSVVKLQADIFFNPCFRQRNSPGNKSGVVLTRGHGSVDTS